MLMLESFLYCVFLLFSASGFYFVIKGQMFYFNSHHQNLIEVKDCAVKITASNVYVKLRCFLLMIEDENRDSACPQKQGIIVQ